MIRHAMTRLIAIALRMRSAVSWAIRSTAQPDLRTLCQSCRVRDWRGTRIPGPFPAPPHKNCS